MKVIFNSKIVDDSELGFKDFYRAVFFADGLFESIYAEKNSVYFLEEHLTRLFNGMKVLRLEFEFNLDHKFFLDQISNLVAHYNNIEHKRIKILVWRRGEGQYKPNKQNLANYLILIEEAKTFKIEEIKTFKVSNSILLSDNSYSKFKTINALSYAMIGMEIENSMEDEVFIKDSEGFICEASSSNIIGIKGNTIIIPDSNCALNGIMSEFIIQQISNKNFKIQRLKWTEENIASFDSILFSNSFIIKYLLNNKNFPIQGLLQEIGQAKFPKQLLLP